MLSYIFSFRKKVIRKYWLSKECGYFMISQLLSAVYEPFPYKGSVYEEIKENI